MFTGIQITELNGKYIDQEKWYVLYTRPNFEKIIDKRLKELGFHSYLPLKKELRFWNQKKVWIEIPLFRSYVFIKTSLKKKDRVFSLSGILNYVSFGNQLGTLNEDEINRIKKICQFNGEIKIEFEKPEVGKRVEICEGPLKGLMGFLSVTNGKRKIRIRIEKLNCFASIIMDFDSVLLKYAS